MMHDFRIETKNGRLDPTVVASEAEYDRSAEVIVRKIDGGPHFRWVHFCAPLVL